MLNIRNNDGLKIAPNIPAITTYTAANVGIPPISFGNILATGEATDFGRKLKQFLVKVKHIGQHRTIYHTNRFF